MKDPRWHVRLVTSAAIKDYFMDAPLPSDAVAEAFDEVPLDDDFVSVTVSVNAAYRRQEQRELARAYNDLRDAAPEMTREEQLYETQLRG